MAKLPPRPVRRLAVTPLVFVVALAVVVISPLLVLLAALSDLLLRTRWRTSRLTVLAVVFAALEVAGIAIMLVLWALSGFGLWLRSAWMEQLHYAFLRAWLDMGSGTLLACLGLDLEPELQPPRSGAVLVFSRHAGPGDSLLLARELMVTFNRHPRIVARSDLQWGPVVDMLGKRIPIHFLEPNPKDGEQHLRAIARLAGGIGERGALILFPEGGNFTRHRRHRAIRSLARRGHAEHAVRAEEMEHVIAPRPGGAIAAMDAAPHADVVFVAHTGTEHLTSLSTIWRQLPLRDSMRGRYWRVPASDRPTGHEATVTWLFDWWAEIDRWIAAERKAVRSPGG